MKNKIIIGLTILILGTGIIVAFSALNKSKNVKNSENTTDKLQQEKTQQTSPTQMPGINPSQTPIVSQTSEVRPAEQAFEISGSITSVSGNTFVVNGRVITINPSRVVNFQQTTGVIIGNQVKIEGIVDNGTFFAREIKPLTEDNSGKN